MAKHNLLKIPGIAGIELFEDELDAHVMRPRHVTDAIGDHGPEIAGKRLKARHHAPSGAGLTHLSVNDFKHGIEAALKDSCVGFCMQLRQHGVSVAEKSYQFSQIPVGGTDIHWTFDMAMHIASLSKLITAISITKVLDDLGVSPDSAISQYLPVYWTQGPNISEILFSNLLTHTSGLTSGATDYPSMKTAIETGVTSYGTYQYANMNFSLCRILLAVLNGNIAVGDSSGDSIWDLSTITAFRHYMKKHVGAK